MSDYCGTGACLKYRVTKAMTRDEAIDVFARRNGRHFPREWAEEWIDTFIALGMFKAAGGLEMSDEKQMKHQIERYNRLCEQLQTNWDLATKAADEIARLRAENERLKAENAELREENDRLWLRVDWWWLRSKAPDGNK